MDDEVKTYLSNVAKLAPKTHAAYKLTLDLFQQSCSKIFVHQVTKQDLQAFDSVLLKQGHEDRTRANRIQHVITFLRNKEGRRAGPPVTDVSIRIKYVEQPPEAYTRQELEDLFKASSEDDKLLWRFLLGTGMREAEATIQRWVRRGEIPAIRISDTIRFDPGPLADWIEQRPASGPLPHMTSTSLSLAADGRFPSAGGARGSMRRGWIT